MGIGRGPEHADARPHRAHSGPEEGGSQVLMDAARIRMYEHILDSASDSIFVLSADEAMRFIFVNESSVRSIRRLVDDSVTRGNLIGKPLMDLGYPESFMSGFRAAVLRAIATGTAIEHFTLPRTDGTIYAFECALNRFEIDGLPPSVVGITRDLGARDMAELIRGETLSAEQRARQDAEQAVDLRNDFLSTAAHDLKTPLTAAQGRTQLLRRHVQRAAGDPAALDLARIETHIEGVQAAITQMTHQISELQDVAFLQIGRPLNLSLAMTDLVALVAECIRRVSGSEGIRPIMSFTHPAEPVMAAVDPVRMTRVIDNLLSNAVKYGCPPVVHIEVDLSVRPDGEEEEVVIEVADDGIGIPAADLPRVFARFVRASNVGDINGQGVGLAGARQIARQHGGDLTVTSTEGEGSVFTLVIPRGAVLTSEQMPD